MSSSPPPPPPPSQPSDPTFRFYTPSQATTYAAQRTGYAGPLLTHVLGLHTAAGGSLGTVLDVGTGTGQVVRDVAPLFESAFGVDPGVEMIAKADELGGRTKVEEGKEKEGGGKIVFLVAAAEEIDQLEEVEEGSVDLITAGMAVSTCFTYPRVYNSYLLLRLLGVLPVLCLMDICVLVLFISMRTMKIAG